MGLFFKKEEELVVLLDISSGSVSGALVLKNKKDLPLVLNYVVREFKFRHEFDQKIVMKEMLESLDYVCQKVQKETQALPQKIYCFLDAPWAQATLLRIVLKRDKEFNFTEALAQKLINEEIENFKNDRGDLKQIIDKRTIETSLNGYIVDNPHNKKARSANIEIFLSLASRYLVTKIEDKIQKTFKSKILFTSQSLTDFVFVRSIAESKKDYIILNIRSEYTEFSLVKNNNLKITNTFPLGINSIIRVAAKKMKKSITESSSLFYSFIGDSLEEENAIDISDVSKFAGEMWKSSLKQNLLEVLPNRHIPDNIFLIVDKNIEPWFNQILQYKLFPEFTISNIEFNVIIITRSMLHNLYNLGEGVKPDPNISIKTIFINQN
jgi:cell division ATPase FtsA